MPPGSGLFLKPPSVIAVGIACLLVGAIGGASGMYASLANGRIADLETRTADLEVKYNAAIGEHEETMELAERLADRLDAKGLYEDYGRKAMALYIAQERGERLWSGGVSGLPRIRYENVRFVPGRRPMLIGDLHNTSNTDYRSVRIQARLIDDRGRLMGFKSFSIGGFVKQTRRGFEVYLEEDAAPSIVEMVAEGPASERRH